MSLTTQDLNQHSRYSHEDITLMRETICKGCTTQDFKLFLMVCERTQLCPFSRQIFAVPRWDSKLNRNSMTVQTSIDGFRLVADRTGRYVPGRATAYAYDPQGKLTSATAYIKKQTNDGTWHEISYTAFYEEYCQKTKEGLPTKFWKDMPRVMLAKVAEAACLRKCFPMELSQIYTREEMDQAEVIETVDHEDIKPKNYTKLQELPAPIDAPLQIEQKIDATQLHDLLSKIPGTEDIWRTNMKKHMADTWKIQDYSELTPHQYAVVIKSINLNLEKIKAEAKAVESCPV